VSLSVITRRSCRAVLPLSAIAALLVGCAARTPPVTKYVPPASGQTAKLVMRSTVPAGDNYGVFVYGDSEHCAGARSIGTGTSTRNPATTTLAANQITTVEFYLLKPTREHCSIRYSFTPLAGKTYLLNGSAVERGCMARMMDASDPDNIKPEAAVLRRNPGNSVCLPLSQSRAVSVSEHDASHKSGDAVLRQGVGAEDLQGLIGQ